MKPPQLLQLLLIASCHVIGPLWSSIMDEYIILEMAKYEVETTATRSRVGLIQLKVTKYNRLLLAISTALWLQ
jgi:predicted small integral membrane protein